MAPRAARAAPAPRAAVAGRRRLGAALRWAFALAVLALLGARLSWADLLRAVQAGPVGLLGVYCVVQSLLILATDAFASAVALRRLGCPRPLRDLVVVRGASYVLGLIGYLASQGGLGVYLHRTGAAPRVATAAVVFFLGSTLLVIVALSGLGFAWAGGGPALPALGAMVAASVAAACAYGLVVVLQPTALRQIPLVGEILGTGAAGHAAVLLARLPHVLAVALGHWGALRLWGVPVPLAAGLALMPLVLLVTALPITPGGLGASQAVQWIFFAGFALGATPEQREVTVVGFALAYHALGVGFQTLLGLGCLPLLGRTLPARDVEASAPAEPEPGPA